MSGRKPVHAKYSSLLLLLFIFLKVRNRECWRHDRAGPSPNSHEKPGQIPCSRFPHPCGPGIAGVYSQQSWGGPLLLWEGSEERSRVRGDPKLHSQLACLRDWLCHAGQIGLLITSSVNTLPTSAVDDLSFSSSLAALRRRVKQRRGGQVSDISSIPSALGLEET